MAVACRLSTGYDGKLQLWDVAYWTERLKQEKYAYDEEALRPYFSLPKVLKGMFGIASKLFGVDIAQDDEAAERWHPDVMFKVQDAGKDIASFFLDPYARPGEKRGGAWMDDCLGRSKAVGTKPVAYLNCNGSPPVGTKPSLMTFSEAETLFHEFGHGLQHMLTHVEDGECAGINNVEWDAVELPSQFMGELAVPQADCGLFRRCTSRLENRFLQTFSRRSKAAVFSWPLP